MKDEGNGVMLSNMLSREPFSFWKHDSQHWNNNTVVDAKLKMIPMKNKNDILSCTDTNKIKKIFKIYGTIPK